MDRLSPLPNELLIIILSLLPTKSAIATTVLSRSWLHLWTNITALRFPINVNRRVSIQNVYLPFFHTVRQLSWRKLRTIELFVEGMSLKLPQQALFALIFNDFTKNAPNLKEFKVHFENFSVYPYVIELPASRVFQMRSLEIAEVHGFKLVNQGVTLPNLRKLVITISDFNQHAFGNLVTSCPSLEILRVNVHVVLDKFQDPIEIKAQNLKWLSVTLDGKHIEHTNKIVLAVPKLEYLELNSPVILKVGFMKTSGDLVKAKVFMGDRNPNGNPNPKQGLMAIINPIFRARTLALSGAMVLALSSLECNVQTFHRLTRLEMDLSYALSLRGVNRFLQSCPNLDTLVLRKGETWHDEKLSPQDKSQNCFDTKIQKIEMVNFNGSKFDRKLIKFLSLAKDLKAIDVTMNISENDITNKKETSAKVSFIEELQKLSSKLPNCHINVSINMLRILSILRGRVIYYQ